MSLDRFFNPESVIVVGASEKPGTIGRAIIENLLTRFKGKIYPVNIKYDKVFGLKCYRDVLEVKEGADLAVIAIPARFVRDIVDKLGRIGVRAAIIISAGFREIGSEGERREREVVETARKWGIRIVGPNCLGIYDAYSGLDTIFNPNDRQGKPSPGNVAFISQSGALGAALLDWLTMARIGLSKFISYGNAADVDESDLIEFLADDPLTKVITAYIEGVRDGRKFMRAVKKAVERGKPVVVLKAGKTEYGAKAATSHTGSLAGTYEVYDAALRQSGALIVNNITELIMAAKVLSMQPPPTGHRVAIVTNGGGAGVLTTDEVISSGLIMARLDDGTIMKLRNVLPEAASPYNPVDILGDAPAERYIKSIKIVMNDNNVDSIIVITIMQSPAFNPKEFIEGMKEIIEKTEKPILMIAPGGEYTEKWSIEIERELRIPVFKSPEECVKALIILTRFGDILGRYRQ